MKKSGQNKIIIVVGVLVVVACFFGSISPVVHEQGTLAWIICSYTWCYYNGRNYIVAFQGAKQQMM